MPKLSGKAIAAIAAGAGALLYLGANAGSGPGSAPSATSPLSAGLGGGSDVTMVRNATIGAQYGAPGPRSCPNRRLPQSGTLTPAEARAYIACDNEGVSGETLILIASIDVRVATGRPYNYVTDNFEGIDRSKLVYDIRGSSVDYSCVIPDPAHPEFQPCARTEDPNAQGRCFQDSDGDWHCSWTASVLPTTDTRLRVPAPSEREAD